MRKSFPLYLRDDLGARLKGNLKMLLGAIVYPLQTRRWRRFVGGNAVLDQLAQRYPRVRHKIYRPYLCKSLSCADRVQVLQTHYRHVFNAGLGELVGQAATAAVSLADFAGKSDCAFQLHLSAINDGHREGELTLKLLSQGESIYACSFVLSELDGQPCIAIGALQGLRSLEGAETIKRVTRELHGCRPKKLMVWMVRAIGSHFGCATVLLVSNKNRIAVNGRRAKRISSNYDETWEEMGAIRRLDGNYALPCAPPAQDIEALPSHKRAEARRRNALLDALAISVRTSLETRRRRTPHSPASNDSVASCANHARGGTRGSAYQLIKTTAP